ncbi:hypothetical protein SK128_014608 [Halocaridina rubra]|uniref:C1q domain-containing protein n=1 Tax=Halocaridina rubra TaxID=373956 RepID=A0AAN8WUJ8_HALRR
MFTSGENSLSDMHQGTRTQKFLVSISVSICPVRRRKYILSTENWIITMLLSPLFVIILSLIIATESSDPNPHEEETQVEMISDREETTEKSAAQVFPYNPVGTRGVLYPANTLNRPTQIYTSGITPNVGYPYNVNLYNSNNPATNPAYNPSAANGVNYNPTQYIPTGYNPSNIIPTRPSGGGYNPFIIPTVTTGGVNNPSSIIPTRQNGGGYIGNGLSEAFTVRKAVPYTRAASKIVFTETVTQVGTGWNTARSEFVATFPGLFFFAFSVVSEQNSHFRVSLVRNGVDVISAFGDVSGYQMGSQSVVLNLSTGDRVYLQLQEGVIHEANSSRAYTSFTGYKIL